MIRYYVIIGILAALLAFYRWLWSFWRKQARFWRNHADHWHGMYNEAKYGVPYEMPENFNTEPDPFKINFEPQNWGAEKKNPTTEPNSSNPLNLP